MAVAGGEDHEPEVVRQHHSGREDARRLSQPDDNLGARYREALSRPNVERDTLPSRRLETEPDDRERLDLRLGRNARLLPVSAKLSADDILGAERGNRLQDFHLLIPQRLAVHPRRRLHGEVAQHLEEVILDDVPDRARRIVEGAAALDSEVLRHGDLNALHVCPIPERLQDRVREAKEQHVVDGAFAEVVVDPEDVGLGERAEQDPVQGTRRHQIRPEWFLDDDAGTVGASRMRQLFDDGSEKRGGDRQVVHGVLRAAELTPKCRKGRRVCVVAVDVAQQPEEPFESRTMDATVPRTLSRARARSWSRVQPALATPMTGTLRSPRAAIDCSAGKIFLNARSPVAPKKTSASECVSPIAIPSAGPFVADVNRCDHAVLTAEAFSLTRRRAFRPTGERTQNGPEIDDSRPASTGHSLGTLSPLHSPDGRCHQHNRRHDAPEHQVA